MFEIPPSPMKPHILVSRNSECWLCSYVARVTDEEGQRRLVIQTPYGMGRTPKEAYHDWMSKTPGY